MDAAAADEVENRVFLTHGNTRERLWRFGILMVLATAIATFGLATDSTAVVIGAMLVAPLMTPILGTSAGLINGKTRSTLWSASITVLGSAGAIAVAWGLSAMIPDLEAVVQNGQITSRTSPSLLDLAIALAAGAAGAYGVSRAESTDALPGVAVAIALVPPLAVVGITLHAGDLGQAGGALSAVPHEPVLHHPDGWPCLRPGWIRIVEPVVQPQESHPGVLCTGGLCDHPDHHPAGAHGEGCSLSRRHSLRDASGAVSDWLGEDSELRISSIEVDGRSCLRQPDRPRRASGRLEPFRRHQFRN